MVRQGRGDRRGPGTKGEWSGKDQGSDQVAKPQEGVWQAPLNPLSGGKTGRGEMEEGRDGSRVPADRPMGRGGGVNGGVDPSVKQLSERIRV